VCINDIPQTPRVYLAPFADDNLSMRPIVKRVSYVGFEVFTVVTMKNAVFWDVAPCRSCVNRRFGGMYHLPSARNCGLPATCLWWFLALGFFYPEDGGDTFLRNVGSHKIYMAPHRRRWHTSEIVMFSESCSEFSIQLRRRTSAGILKSMQMNLGPFASLID
jgi:hypothetical protein